MRPLFQREKSNIYRPDNRSRPHSVPNAPGTGFNKLSPGNPVFFFTHDNSPSLTSLALIMTEINQTSEAMPNPNDTKKNPITDQLGTTCCCQTSNPLLNKVKSRIPSRTIVQTATSKRTRERIYTQPHRNGFLYNDPKAEYEN